MNEIFDKLAIRVLTTLLICFFLWLYKYAHFLLYPASRSQIQKRFYPTRNFADTLHLFSRIVALGLVYSHLELNLEHGPVYALIEFAIHALISFVLYLISLYVIESIILYNFEYADEVIKRKNLTYSTISFAIALTVGLMLSVVIDVSGGSLANLLFLWPMSIVLLGFATKLYPFVSRFSFNKLVIHKNMAIAFSYLGHLFGVAILIGSALKQNLVGIELYTLGVLVKITLSLIILPLFQKGLIFAFKIADDLPIDEGDESNGPTSGHGLYEGGLFFTAAILTNTVTSSIFFGNYYPLF